MNYSLQGRMSQALSVSAIAIILIASIVSAVMTYAAASDEQDEQLTMVAQLASRSPAEPREIEDDDDPAAALFIAAPGALISPKDHSRAWRLPEDIAEGLASVEMANRRYRFYTATRADGTGRVSAAQSQQVRTEAVLQALATAVLPLVGSVVLIWLVIRAQIRRTFQSIGELGRDLVKAPSGAATHDVPTELLPFIGEVQTAWQQQRALLEGRARFVSNVAHELRSPLAALSLQIDNVASIDLPDEARQRLDLVRGGAKRTAQLLQQLLDLGAIQQGGTDRSSRVEVATVLRDAIELVIPFAASRDIELQVERLDTITCTGSSTALMMLIRNALDNAVRYSPAGSTIEISVVRSEQHLVLLVADQGSGMDPEDMERAFEPFFRSARAHDESGSGLGLAIVAEAATLLGGSARLKPRKQKGMTFEYCQPLHEPDTGSALAEPFLPLPKRT